MKYTRECFQRLPTHRSDFLEGVLVDVGEDVAFWVGEDLEGDGAVVIL